MNRLVAWKRLFGKGDHFGVNGRETLINEAMVLEIIIGSIV